MIITYLFFSEGKCYDENAIWCPQNRHQLGTEICFYSSNRRWILKRKLSLTPPMIQTTKSIPLIFTIHVYNKVFSFFLSPNIKFFSCFHRTTNFYKNHPIPFSTFQMVSSFNIFPEWPLSLSLTSPVLKQARWLEKVVIDGGGYVASRWSMELPLPWCVAGPPCLPPRWLVWMERWL